MLVVFVLLALLCSRIHNFANAHTFIGSLEFLGYALDMQMIISCYRICFITRSIVFRYYIALQITYDVDTLYTYDAIKIV